jgi:hypothetical protein
MVDGGDRREIDVRIGHVIECDWKAAINEWVQGEHTIIVLSQRQDEMCEKTDSRAEVPEVTVPPG